MGYIGTTIRNILGLYWGYNGKENGNDYIIIAYLLGLYWGYIRVILG